MKSVVYRAIPLNPEPWAMGELTIARARSGAAGHNRMKAYPKAAPNEQLLSFQNAVREELVGEAMLPWDLLELKFYFWRKLDQYAGPSGRMVTKREADTTNLQKGLEDALQGFLFKNDRYNRKVTSEIVSQSIHTKPMILIVAREYIPVEPDVPQEVMSHIKSLWGEPIVNEQQPLFDVEAHF